MSRDRGTRAPHWLVRYLRESGWPSAEVTGAGRKGTDVLGTPGIVWENKTANEWRVKQWVEQAKSHTRDGIDLPVTVYWPNGVGETTPQAAMAILPLPDLVCLLIEAGYTGDRPRVEMLLAVRAQLARQELS